MSLILRNVRGRILNMRWVLTRTHSCPLAHVHIELLPQHKLNTIKATSMQKSVLHTQTPLYLCSFSLINSVSSLTHHSDINEGVSGSVHHPHMICKFCFLSIALPTPRSHPITAQMNHGNSFLTEPLYL